MWLLVAAFVCMWLYVAEWLYACIARNDDVIHGKVLHQTWENPYYI